MHDIFERLAIQVRQDATLAAQVRQQITWLIASGELRPGEPLPTVRGLAQHLGINLHTVRDAYLKLAADGLVETRQGSGTRVRPLAPAALAQLAATLRSHTVGVILPSLSSPFYHLILEGIEEVADADRTLLFVCATHDDPGEAWRYFAQLSAKHVDGIILASHDDSELGSCAPGNTTTRLPLVSIDWPDSRCPAVLMDLADAGFLATSHLLSHGHRRIGLITPAPAVSNVWPLEAGYRRALGEPGLAPAPELIARVAGFGMEAGMAGARALLSLPQPPTAIYACADLLAVGALRALKEAGRRVPDDVALVGFTDISLARLVDPPLTTVAAPARRMGAEAMRMLQRLINGDELAIERVTLPVSLVVRASCGAHI